MQISQSKYGMENYVFSIRLKARKRKIGAYSLRNLQVGEDVQLISTYFNLGIR